MRKDFPTPPLSALITSGAFVILFPGRLSLPSKTSILWSSFFACAPNQKSMFVFSLCYHIRYYLLDVVVSPRINSVSYRSSSWSFSNLSLIPFLCIPTFVFLYKIVFLHPCSPPISSMLCCVSQDTNYLSRVVHLSKKFICLFFAVATLQDLFSANCSNQ